MLHDINEIRRMNMRRVVELFGIDEVCRRAQLSEVQLNQYIGPNPTRNIGDTVARRTEEALSLQPNWMDNVQGGRNMLHEVMTYVQTLPPERFDEFLSSLRAARRNKTIAKLERSKQNASLGTNKNRIEQPATGGSGDDRGKASSRLTPKPGKA